jgi:RNA polymerase sigma-70 factor, ECF subfamily
MIKSVKSIRNTRRPIYESDQELIQSFKNGAPDGFSRIYTRYRKPVLKMISSRIRNSDVTEELTQEVFLRVFRFQNHFNPEYEFSTWLWTIARNIVSDYLSNSQSDPLAAKSQVESTVELNELVSTGANAEFILLKKSERRYLIKMLGKLPKLQRKAILLRVIRGCSYCEIAKAMHLSLSAVKSLIHRAKASLQLLMEASLNPTSVENTL